MTITIDLSDHKCPKCNRIMDFSWEHKNGEFKRGFYSCPLHEGGKKK